MGRERVVPCRARPRNADVKHLFEVEVEVDGVDVDACAFPFAFKGALSGRQPSDETG